MWFFNPILFNCPFSFFFYIAEHLHSAAWELLSILAQTLPNEITVKDWSSPWVLQLAKWEVP